MIIHAHTS
ncbi:hypothetical protein D049_1478A, partial [Vibrio parahaemolyticus VPTS-2010]